MLKIQNPITVDRRVMRRSALATLLEIMEYNATLSDRLALFEIGPVFLPVEGQQLPNEKMMLSIGLTGLRTTPDWQNAATEVMDFYDLKGVIEGMMAGLHIDDVTYMAAEHPSLHPGKSADVLVNGKKVGAMGELHPLAKANYELGDAPVYLADSTWSHCWQRPGSCLMWNPSRPTHPCWKIWLWWWMKRSRLPGGGSDPIGRRRISGETAAL